MSQTIKCLLELWDADEVDIAVSLGPSPRSSGDS